MSDYPCIKISSATNNLVLFTEPKVGYIIYTKNTEYALCEYGTCWKEEEVFREIKDINDALTKINCALETINLPLDIIMLISKQEKILRESK